MAQQERTDDRLRRVCREAFDLTNDVKLDSLENCRAALDRLRRRLPELLDEVDGVATCLEQKHPLGEGENFPKLWNLSVDLKRMTGDMRSIIDAHLSGGNFGRHMADGGLDVYLRVSRRLQPIAERMENLCQNLGKYDD